jgi:hypothetical protein
MRKTLLSILALALFAALPAVAGQAPSAQPAVAAPTAALATPACEINLASPFAGLAPAAPTAPAEPEWMALGGASSRKFHGFCRCGCSSNPDCNTDADCGGGVGSCSQFISCC